MDDSVYGLPKLFFGSVFFKRDVSKSSIEMVSINFHGREYYRFG